jgi:hypothetical protein
MSRRLAAVAAQVLDHLATVVVAAVAVGEVEPARRGLRDLDVEVRVVGAIARACVAECGEFGLFHPSAAAKADHRPICRRGGRRDTLGGWRARGRRDRGRRSARSEADEGIRDGGEILFHLQHVEAPILEGSFERWCVRLPETAGNLARSTFVSGRGAAAPALAFEWRRIGGAGRAGAAPVGGVAGVAERTQCGRIGCARAGRRIRGLLEQHHETCDRHQRRCRTRPHREAQQAAARRAGRGLGAQGGAPFGRERGHGRRLLAQEREGRAQLLQPRAQLGARGEFGLERARLGVAQLAEQVVRQPGLGPAGSVVVVLRHDWFPPFLPYRA